MKKILLLIGFVLSIYNQVNGQAADSLLAGKVSYITAQNVYVKFANTENIHPGDTIFRKVNDKLVPLFIVENISSVSCVGKLFPNIELKVDEEIASRIPKRKQSENTKVATPANTSSPQSGKSTDQAASTEKGTGLKRQQDIQGSLSISSYSNLSNTDIDNTQRMRYTFSLRANNVAKSPISAESYISFTHRLNNWSEVQQNIFSALKIYSLAIKYDIGTKANIWAGRKINQNISNIGAVDGIQAEAIFGKFTFGAVAGSRPNDVDYNINFKLPEFGAFIGHILPTKNGRMQTSAAFFEQRNGGTTDRRFLYFQHDNSLLKNLYFFTSCELDLYKVVEGIPKNSPTVTGLYFSLRYKVIKQLSLFASYDARKNVIYYETYKGVADRLLEEATRQGLQFRVNYRPGNMISMGANAGYRFRDNDLNPNENLNGFLTFNQLPWIKASATLTANFLKTSYLDGKIFGIRLSRDIIPGKLYSEVNYRFIDYNFKNSSTKLIQNIAQVNLSWQFKNKMSFSIDYELTLEPVNKYHRIYVSFNKRF